MFRFLTKLHSAAECVVLRLAAYGLIIVVISLVVPSGCGRFEIHEASYKTYDEAVAKGAIGRRLPEFMPHSATEITERFDKESNELWLRFSFAKADLPGMLRHFETAEPDEIVYPRPGGTRSTSWWPRDLRGPEAEPGSTARIYRWKFDSNSSLWFKWEDVFLALGEDSTTAYFWVR